MISIKFVILKIPKDYYDVLKNKTNLNEEENKDAQLQIVALKVCYA